MIPKEVLDALTSTADSKVFETPDKYGLKYKTITITTEDNIPLEAWLIEPKDQSKNRVIISSHWGNNASKAGFQTKPETKQYWENDITFGRRYKDLSEKGYTQLVFDSRNHGNSGKTKSGKGTSGKEESLDWIAVTNWLINQDDYKDTKIGLLGICASGNAMTMAFDKELRDIDNIKATIVVQPSKYSIILSQLGMDEKMIKELSKLNIEEGGHDFYTSAKPFAKLINKPTLFVNNINDPMMKQTWVKSWYNEIVAPKELMELSLVPKRLAAYEQINKDGVIVDNFFKKYL